MTTKKLLDNIRYEPPTSVWGQIEAELDQPVVVRLSAWQHSRRIWLTAASLVLLAGIGYWFWISQSSEALISVRVEKLEKPLIVHVKPNIEQQNARVQAYCKIEHEACDQPEFKMLKTELDQLNAAHEQLRKVMGDYNTDPMLVAQLDQIETSRADVLKKLTTKI